MSTNPIEISAPFAPLNDNRWHWVDLHPVTKRMPTRIAPLALTIVNRPVAAGKAPVDLRPTTQGTFVAGEEEQMEDERYRFLGYRGYLQVAGRGIMRARFMIVVESNYKYLQADTKGANPQKILVPGRDRFRYTDGTPLQ